MADKFWQWAIVIWLAVVSATVQGGLIVDPLGTVLFDGTPRSDGNRIDTVRVELTGGLAPGAGFRFFGHSVGSLWVSENGLIGFSQLPSGKQDFFSGPLGSSSSVNSSSVAGTAMIAPLWDDYSLQPSSNNSVMARYLPNQYLQVTWSNVLLDFEAPGGEPVGTTNRSIQMLWFDGDTTIRGFDFQQGDIAFGYIPHTTTGPEFFGDIYATAGLDQGNGNFSSIPGTTDGTLFSSDGGLLAWQENDFLLFRPGMESVVPDGFLSSDYQGGYYRGTFTLTAVPEPSSWMLLLVPLVYRTLRRGKSPVPVGPPISLVKP